MEPVEIMGEVIGEYVGSNFFFAGIGSVVGILLLARLLKSQRPALVGVTKEAVAFKHWLDSSMAESKEFWEDVVAEAKHQYKLEVDRKLEILQRQQDILQKLRATL